ncbi:MAG: bis(5'-nucleosyl)-tetraphosphatase (symmetrical) YqeK [Clostridia bacterium]|nr:bis(5'-nucleosyl)-tetraphosphatase (symmetrical) YqeK [Clostridia bacterium]
MVRTVIYGGSFDPIHRGHEAIINNLAARFDEVIVVPTSVSPFKQGGSAATSQQRWQMLCACHFPSNVWLSDYEINKAGCSYSIDTVRHFASKDRELYFAIGSEGARSLNKWRNADELKRLCKFYAIKRPGYDGGEHCADIVMADFCGEDVSSSEVKLAIAFDRLQGLVNERVAKIIKENDLYNDYNHFTAAFKTFGLSDKRINHTYNAAGEGIKLAKRYDVDIKSVIIALILHDIGKNMTAESLKKIGISAPDCSHLPIEVRHAEYGAAIAEQMYNQPKEICDAIRTHTVCGMDMTELAEIVALADYIEPSRCFDGVDEVRKAACEDLSLAIQMMLKNTIDYLQQQGKYVVPITKQVYDLYTKKIKKEE